MQFVARVLIILLLGGAMMLQASGCSSDKKNTEEIPVDSPPAKDSTAAVSV